MTGKAQLLPELWGYLLVALTLTLAILAAGHAVLYKRDPRSALGWLGFIWLAPLVGAVVYFTLGVNRLKRRAVLLRKEVPKLSAPSAEDCRCGKIEDSLPKEAQHLATLSRLSEKVIERDLVCGNTITPLIDGDSAYPAMLQAIDNAKKTVSLATYIFDLDPVGRTFVEALARAVQRGVEVRVLIDAAGARYSFPSILGLLRRRGIRAAKFLPTRLPFNVMSINLRNHRKILVVDGSLGFTGGMNIREGHQLSRKPRHPVQDIHFQVEGPLVKQLQEVFAEDWLFTAGELLEGEKWFPALGWKGTQIARSISDGPDEDFEKLRWVILGALASAKSYVRIVTPYYLPDQAVISALNTAAMRGVVVDIVLPSRSNLLVVQWATFAQLWQVLEHGCRVWLTPPPFDHSKLMVIDDYWSLVGSANWDARSLRLNFEFNIECYDGDLAKTLDQIAREKISNARLLTLADVDRRPVPVRLRDGLARLLTPYL